MKKKNKRIIEGILAVVASACAACFLCNTAHSANTGELEYYGGSEEAATYKSDGAEITVYTGKYDDVGGKAKYYAAHVKLKDYSKMYLAKANGERSNGFQTIPEMVKTKDTRAYNAVLAVNGPFNGGDDDKWVRAGMKWRGVAYHDYYEIVNGKYYEGKTGFGDKNVGDYITYSSTTGMLASGVEQDGVTKDMALEEAASKGLISDTFNGDMGYYVLKDGAIQGKEDREGLRQRTFIGTNGEPGDFWIVVCNGKSSYGIKADLYSEGLNTYGEGAILKKLGCTTGYNLDGGGSSTMVFKGEMINKQFFTRKCYDALCIEK